MDDDGYVDLARQTLSATRRLVAGIADVPSAVEKARTATSGLDPALLEAVRALDPDEPPDDVLGTLLPMVGLEPGAVLFTPTASSG